MLLDCRWLGRGGPGRATELLLRGLEQLQPPGNWILWGPDAVGRYLWSGARHEPTPLCPRDRWGQREQNLPRADLHIYMHQIRPLMRRHRSLTLIHDSIPLRAGTPVARWLKRSYLRRSAALSSKVVTVSEYSRRQLAKDLAIRAEEIAVVRYPSDPQLAEAVLALRGTAEPRDTVFFLGRFAPHKNLERLIRAFQSTRFLGAGGTLRIVGGTPEEVERLSGYAASIDARGVSIEGGAPEAVIKDLYATGRALVMPSLEEGFGLPVWEALCCGLPVCISSGGSLPEITNNRIPPFDPLSEAEMAAAIDETVTGERVPDFAAVADEIVGGAPSIAEFAEVWLGLVEECLATP